MKSLYFFLLLLLSACCASAQTTLPNLGLVQLPYQYPHYEVPTNANWGIVDGLFSNGTCGGDGIGALTFNSGLKKFGCKPSSFSDDGLGTLQVVTGGGNIALHAPTTITMTGQSGASSFVMGGDIDFISAFSTSFTAGSIIQFSTPSFVISGSPPVDLGGGLITVGSLGANLSVCTDGSKRLTTSGCSGGGSGTTINPTNGVLPKRLNSTTFADSCFLDDGTLAQNACSGGLQAGPSGTDGGVELPNNSTKTVGASTNIRIISDGGVFKVSENAGSYVEVAKAAGVNAQAGTTYPVIASDRGKLITLTNPAAIAVTLPQAGTTGFTGDFAVMMRCFSNISCTITPTTSTINGNASTILPNNASELIFSDGTNYFAVRAPATYGGVNAQTTTYTAILADTNRLIAMNGSSLTLNLPATVPNSLWETSVTNLNASPLTISRNGLTINGGTSNITLQQYQGVRIWSNGSNYLTTEVPLVAGSNVTLTPASNGITVASTGGGGTGVGRFSGAIDFPSIPDGTCNAQTFTATGTATSDTVTAGWPSALTAGLIGNMFVSASNTITVNLCNFSGAAVDLGSLTYRATLAVYNLNGSGTIDFASIADGTCLANTFTLTGTSAGDPVVPGWPSALNAGLLGSMVASATDTINVTLCNFSGAAVDPASLVYKASIAK